MIPQASELGAIRFKAHRYAASRGLSYADDFASYCVEQAMLGRPRNHRFLLVDFRRETFGNKRTNPGKLKSSETTEWVPALDVAPKNGEPGVVLSGILQPASFPVEGILDAAKANQMERACLVLAYHWGMSREEISRVFGVDASRVSQIIGKAAKKARKRLKREEWGY